MAEALREPFCPLYQEAVADRPWENVPSANRGLLFDKFANAWRIHKGKYEFDKGDKSKKENQQNEAEKACVWLRKMAAKCGDPDRLKEVQRRQRKLVDSMGGRTLLLKNTSRFVTGLGREHPLENGFAWHQTLGVPYLPSSSLKGMLRAWYREAYGELGTDKQEKPKWKETPQTEDLFGTQNGVGQFILLDMIPTSPVQLAVDIMTPHYGPYYQDDQGKTAPGDWHSPVPISFLTVEAGASWQVAILPGPKQRTVTDDQLSELHAALVDVFAWLGAGAKTAVGYGRFERDTEGEKRLREEEEQIFQAQAEEAQRKAEDAEFEKSLESASPELRQLKTLQRDEKWNLSAADDNMLSALETFAENHNDPPQDCLDWIRDLLESIPKYKGVWDNPEATRGKKNKPKYGSKRIRELVHRFHSDRGS